MHDNEQVHATDVEMSGADNFLAFYSELYGVSVIVHSTATLVFVANIGICASRCRLANTSISQSTHFRDFSSHYFAIMVVNAKWYHAQLYIKRRFRLRCVLHG